MIYCYPRLSERDFYLFRLFGPGLGNLLFPWARAVVYAHQHDCRMIASTWPQIKLGTLIRGELDARTYMGLFSPRDNDLVGISRLRVLALGRRVPEGLSRCAKDGDVIEFSGMEGLFSPLLGYNSLVRNALLDITRPEHTQCLDFDFSGSVSLHVRLGDFAVARSGAALGAGQTNTRLPIEWYVNMLQGVREMKGENIPAYIFSDGSDAELTALLNLPNCHRLGFGSAIADMLALSKAEILIASGSTFSKWASFIGGMPIIWYPGQMKQSLYEREGREFEMLDFDAGLFRTHIP